MEITPTGSVRIVGWKPPGRAHSPTAASPLTFSVMSCQTTLSDGAQRTLTECVDTTEREDDTPTTERALLDRTYQHAVEVAPEYSPDQAAETIEEKNWIAS